MKHNSRDSLKEYILIFKFCLFICLFFNNTNSFSQTNTQNDSISILSFVDKIIVKLNLDTQNDSFFVDIDNDTDLEISTNNQYRLNLSLDYEFIGASIGFSPKFIPGNNDDSFKGKSSFIDYKFRFFIGKWTQEVQYSKNEGYYVKNTNDFTTNWSEGEDSFIQFPNLKNTIWQGSTSYVLNSNFSLRNVVYNTEWQIKSAGSFVPTIKYSYSRLSGTIGNSNSYDNSYSIGLSPDYYYTLVLHKHWFTSLSLSPGISIEYVKSGQTGNNIIEHNTHFPISFNSGLQIGYSSSKIIFGTNVRFDSNWYHENRNTRVTNNKLFGKIYFGYRFNAPNPIKKSFNWINTKLGI